MTKINDFNAQLIDEFRQNGGKAGGRFAGLNLVLITHTGAKTGVQRTTPLVCSTDHGNVVIIASMGGAPTNPAWYHNLVANPEVTVEHGNDTYRARAVEATGDERLRLFAQQAATMPFFNDYQAKTSRTIPVLVLEPID
jgi:deazaflavin-dependent oxidoreductase (nitroreductase family)